MSLPARRREDQSLEPAPPPAPAIQEPKQGATRVLLIDDDRFAFEVLSDGLARYPERYAITWKSSFEEGLKALLEIPFDVCLLDYQLDRRTGLELLRAATEQACRVPIVMLTSTANLQLEVETMRAGAADYLIKGQYDPALIDRCLRYAVGRAGNLEALRQREERYAQAVAGANDGLWDWKLDTGEVYFSPRWKEILGYSDAELPNRMEEWYARVHPSDLEKLKAELAAHLEGRVEKFGSVHRLRHKDGSYRWVQTRGLAVRDCSGQATRLAGAQQDVTQSIGHDSLTGLLNRLSFLDRLETRMARPARAERSYAVLLLDLDRFKVVNDSLGHRLGDELLVQLGTRLAACVRKDDALARVGGDEFTLLLPGVCADDAVRVASRIQDRLAKPFCVSGTEVFVTVSIGVAMGAPGYLRPEELLRDADTALHRAKSAGRARCALFDQPMHAQALSRLQLESDLRRSVEHGELRLVYQPIFRLASGALCGAEVLVRWDHPKHGLVPPGEFIPLAEEIGFVEQIDSWVLLTACGQLQAWRKELKAAPLPYLSSNVSKQFLQSPRFLIQVDEALATTGLPASALVLELTEGTLLEDPEGIRNLLLELRSRGVGMTMDDFGTGYSSLSYLHRLPFTGLKIDRSFVQPLRAGQRSQEIVSAIIRLAQGLELPVTAEGVETQEQLACLRELGCDAVQGYLLSKPIGASEFEALLRKG